MAFMRSPVRSRSGPPSFFQSGNTLLALLLIGPSAYAKDVTVQVNGRPVRLDVASPARPNATSPTIVFESGLGTPGTGDFARVLPLLPKRSADRSLRPAGTRRVGRRRRITDASTHRDCIARRARRCWRRRPRTSWSGTHLAARESGCSPASTRMRSPASFSSTRRQTSPGRPMMTSATSLFRLGLDRKNVTKCARCRSRIQRRRNRSSPRRLWHRRCPPPASPRFRRCRRCATFQSWCSQATATPNGRPRCPCHLTCTVGCASGSACGTRHFAVSQRASREERSSRPRRVPIRFKTPSLG